MKIELPKHKTILKQMELKVLLTQHLLHNCVSRHPEPEEATGQEETLNGTCPTFLMFVGLHLHPGHDDITTFPPCLVKTGDGLQD